MTISQYFIDNPCGFFNLCSTMGKGISWMICFSRGIVWELLCDCKTMSMLYWNMILSFGCRLERDHLMRFYMVLGLIVQNWNMSSMSVFLNSFNLLYIFTIIWASSLISTLKLYISLIFYSDFNRNLYVSSFNLTNSWPS